MPECRVAICTNPGKICDCGCGYCYCSKHMDVQSFEGESQLHTFVPVMNIDRIAMQGKINYFDYAELKESIKENKSISTSMATIQDRIVFTQFDIPIRSNSYGSTSIGQMYPYGVQNPSMTAFQVPASQTWQLVDMYTTTPPDVDGQISIIINGTHQSESFFASAINMNNINRARLTMPIVVQPGDVFQINYSTVHPTTEAATVRIYMHIIIM